MPELPEVEVVRAGLQPAVTGAAVASVTVLDSRSLRRHDGPSEDFVARLTGARFASAERRGKFLWLPLATDPHTSPTPEGPKTKENAADSAVKPVSAHDVAQSPSFSSQALVVHLGMSGQVLLRDRQTDDALTRIRIELEHPAHGPLRLNFVDQRIFGSMAIDSLVPASDGHGVVPSQVAHISRDPLDEYFDDALFFARLRKRNTGIKRALLDQTLISGIGNIYADEALWASRIHYDQSTALLSLPRAKILLAEVRAVLIKALAEGGTSFDAQYVNVNGNSGYFSHSLKAYGQQGKPCARCGRPLVREQFMNRGSHFCPFCQRVRGSAG
ncbi:MAG: bifunctional DNA-formamidopyrimidine glycosylase/DNA-(apurinic or apyrimidinic site) lyase [Microbacteriaceae bacterium]